MTSSIFEEWIRSWDEQLERKGRKVLVFLDNCSSHPKLLLKSIKPVFMPPSTTSHTQPLDQGIIKTWKSYYRQRVLDRIMGYMDDGCLASEIAQNFNIGCLHLGGRCLESCETVNDS